MKIFLLFTFLFLGSLTASDKAEFPKLLYKLTTEKLWKESQEYDELILSKSDRKFIHLAEEDDIERIMQKYFPDEKRVVVLTLETNDLKGTLVKEVNPGGNRMYYHLYKGSIPFDAIVAVKIVNTP